MQTRKAAESLCMKSQIENESQCIKIQIENDSMYAIGDVPKIFWRLKPKSSTEEPVFKDLCGWELTIAQEEWFSKQLLHQFDGNADMIGDLSEVKFSVRYNIKRSTARGWKRRFLKRKLSEETPGVVHNEKVRPPLTEEEQHKKVARKKFVLENQQAKKELVKLALKKVDGNIHNRIYLKESDDGSESDDEDAECHHPGDLKPSGSKFYDWNVACGPINSNYVRRTYPENYVWTCCSEVGTSRGCTKGDGESIEEKYATSPERGENEKRHMGNDLEFMFYDFDWGKYDEEKDGKIDSKVHQKNFPQYYSWECCGKKGADASGCEFSSENEEEEEEEEEEEREFECEKEGADVSGCELSSEDKEEEEEEEREDE